MYLQITTKCNMSCGHCCFSCGKYGRHMKWDTFLDALHFIEDRDSVISIGGGEPTLHPRFFDILKTCLQNFDAVWLAINGSQTNTMFRLANIIDGEDWPEIECTCLEDYGSEELEEYGCRCYEKTEFEQAFILDDENKLSVALSRDPFHDPIDERIIDLWSRRAEVHRDSHYEVRDVTKYAHVINEGRAKITGAANEEGCICSDLVIKPNGRIKLCGCNRSPFIGDVWGGIEEKWEDVLENNERFRDEHCYKALKMRG